MQRKQKNSLKVLDHNPITLSVFGLWEVMPLNESTIRHLTMYNQIWMELDNLYGNYAKHCGLPDCPFWIFYTLYEGKERITYSELTG